MQPKNKMELTKQRMFIHPYFAKNVENQRAFSYRVTLEEGFDDYRLPILDASRNDAYVNCFKNK